MFFNLGLVYLMPKKEYVKKTETRIFSLAILFDDYCHRNIFPVRNLQHCIFVKFNLACLFVHCTTHTPSLLILHF